MVKVVKKDGFDTPVPEVIATFPGERTTPGCKKTPTTTDPGSGAAWPRSFARARPTPIKAEFRAREPMSTFAFLLNQTVNALSQAALLFFLGVGLTLIFGIMRIVNFAHGALYMLGAFVGYSLVRWTGSFWVALAVAPIVVGLGRHGIRARHPAPALPARRPRLPDGDLRSRAGRHARRFG